LTKGLLRGLESAMLLALEVSSIPDAWHSMKIKASTIPCRTHLRLSFPFRWCWWCGSAPVARLLSYPPRALHRGIRLVNFECSVNVSTAIPNWYGIGMLPEHQGPRGGHGPPELPPPCCADSAGIQTGLTARRGRGTTTSTSNPNGMPQGQSHASSTCRH
jgi:hypothetical protein